jgi:Domain of unknown function (DUF4249)
MKPIQRILSISLLLLLNSCITTFIPKTGDNKEMIVVDGLITDQPGKNTIKLSRSLPLGNGNTPIPVKGCIVTVTDDLGNTFNFTETAAGTYTSDSAEFQGSIGRLYTLHINTNSYSNNHNYESYPMEMKPVPPIDSVYYEKVTITEPDKWNFLQEGCQVYLDTHDPTNQCKYYRWKFIETWEFHLPFYVPNRICWISANSELINIKNTSVIEKDQINRYPLNFISNQTDRLLIKYSILVNQYSLNDQEYLYWEQLQKLSEQVGSLYDIIPASVTNNIYCLDDPNEKVLGYFSVSANSSKRIFIKDHFLGVVNKYTIDYCGVDTIPKNGPIPGLNQSVWLIGESGNSWIVTYSRECVDCTVRGTNMRPDYWTENK